MKTSRNSAIGWFFMLIFCVGTVAGGVPYLVSPTGNDSSSGLSWPAALATVTQALAKASSGDEIWVAAGTNLPAAVSASRTNSFTMKSGVDLYGGFAGTESSRDQRNWTNNVTILSGDIGLSGVNTDNCYHVVVGATDARLDGFVVRDGYANGAGADNVSTRINSVGAGMFSYSGSLSVANCVFSNNTAAMPSVNASGGAGLYWSQGGMCAATVTCQNCVFSGNALQGGSSAVAYGGGIGLSFTTNLIGQVLISNCVFRNNSSTGTSCRAGALGLNDKASRPWDANSSLLVVGCRFETNWSGNNYGGGVAVVGFVAPVVFSNNQFAGNFGLSSTAGGGAMYISAPFLGNGLQVDSCTFTTNSGGWGGAISFDTGGGTNSVWRNCTFTDNSAAQGGGAIYGAVDGTFIACGFTNNTAVTYSGGAVYVSGAGAVTNAIFTNCTFTANSKSSSSQPASAGGALYIKSPVRLLGCLLNSSTCTTDGGCIEWITGACSATGVIRNCQFVTNVAASGRSGGAIYVNSGCLDISGSDFIGNSAGNYGGAVYSLAAATTTVSECFFASNSAAAVSGGGVYIAGGGKISRSVFIANTANKTTAGYGGAVCFANSGTLTGVVANCVFRENSAGFGGAIVAYDANLIISNITAYANTSLSATYGGALGNRTASYTNLVENAILWDNGAAEIKPSNGVACAYSCVKGGFAGTGNVDTNPIFADTTYLHLQSTRGNYAGGYFSGGSWSTCISNSPLIDAGNPLSDWSQEPTPNGRQINMGAYGGTALASKSYRALGTAVVFR